MNNTVSLKEKLNTDEYNVTVTYSGDPKYSNVTANAKLTIKQAKSTIDLDVPSLDYGTSLNVTANTTNATGITAKIGDKDLEVNGYNITIPVLDSGNYTLTVTTITDKNHYPVTKNVTITVNKLKTELTATPVTTTYNINRDLVITLKDSKGNPLSGVNLTVNLNGAKTYVTNNNGQIKISTQGLTPKTYTAKITFNGNTNYAESSKDVTITVKKATPKLTAKNKKFKKSKKTKKYSVTLKDNTGKAIKKVKLTLKVKGKTYKAKTNSKGKATFKIKNLKKKGNFKAVIKYGGNSFYKAVSKKVKIKVKK